MNRLLAVALCALLPSLAVASSADVELVRPAPGPGSLPTLPAPGALPKGAVRFSIAAAYAVNPLVAVQADEELFAIVSDRGTAWLGFEAAISKTLALEVTAGAALQRGPIAPYQEDHGSAGLVDPSVGLFWSPARAFGTRLTVWAPVGTKEVWLGERGPRAALDVLGLLPLGRVELMGRLGAVVRAPVEGEWNFQSGPSLSLDPGVRVRITEVVSTSAWLVSRVDQSDDGALIALEPSVGVQVNTGDIGFDAAVSRGFTGGYGTSDVRVVAALHVRRIRPPEPVVAPPVITVAEIEEPEPEPVPVPKPVPSLAVLRSLGDQVQFEQGQAVLTPDGRAAVAAIALLLRTNTAIGGLIVEGHASVEGSDDFNWDLSQRRARTVYETLLEDGVPYGRVSYRGVGEQVPVAEGEDPATLSASRRVVFLVTEIVTTEEEAP